MQRESEILALVNEAFVPEHVALVNESHMHHVPPNSETHFKLVLVSTAFEGQNKVKRHQSVYTLVSSMMQQGLHALALHLYTPSEWQSEQASVPDSPNCMGGSKA